MKTIAFLMMFFTSLALAEQKYSSRNQLIFPESENPDEFLGEVSAFLKSTVERDVNPVSERNEILRKRIMEDPNDWEKALAFIIGNPERYGHDVARRALYVAFHRGKMATNPEIGEASTKLFRHEKSRAIKRQEDDRSAGTDRGSGRVILGGFMATSLRYNLPEMLQEILIYYNSEAETEMNMIEVYPPQNVADALRTYGDERHVDEAKKFVQKLREAGKDDIAGDIERSIKRIEKDQARSKAGSDRKELTSDPAKAADEKAETEKRPSGTFWIVTGLVALIAVVLVRLFRRKG